MPLPGRLLLPIILAACLTGCASDPAAQRAEPKASEQALESLATANSAFAFDLYQVLAGSEENFFYSPYSISLALAMTYAGAREETERQMAETLQFHLPQDSLHPAFNALDLELASHSKDSSEDDRFRLNIVNAIWGQKNYEFLPEFIDVLAENYGAGMRRVDYIGAPEKSRVRINDWVANQTEDRIKDLIPPNAIGKSVRLVLTNAIYFNAAWLYSFDQGDTANHPFYTLDGNKIETPMMKQKERLGYARGDGYQVVEMPYRASRMAMVILLPDNGKFREFERSLDVALVSASMADVRYTEIELTMPKFKLESNFRLADALTAMGMPNAFDRDTADFSGTNGRSCPAAKCLYISNVYHKAFVSVDEEGTEAAAATAVVEKEIMGGGDPVKVTVDRPFILLIRDQKTGTVLFAGRVLTP